MPPKIFGCGLKSGKLQPGVSILAAICSNKLFLLFSTTDRVYILLKSIFS
jgi:hypothetical protein